MGGNLGQTTLGGSKTSGIMEGPRKTPTETGDSTDRQGEGLVVEKCCSEVPRN